MHNRRDVMIGAGLTGMLLSGAGMRASAQPGGVPASDDEVLRSLGYLRPEDDPEFGPVITGDPNLVQSVGTGPSRHAEVSRAFRLLWDAPRTDDPMMLARYFENLPDTNPDAKNASGGVAKYNEEWVDRANPLITGFFGMTGTLPSMGDQTSWCSAFVSFVLYATGKATMLSALSGAYRRYSVATTSPEPGDIVVFRKNGAAGNQGFGHVGFFVSETEERVVVLGGNQQGTTGSTGAVCESSYRKAGQTLTLHSYRKIKPAEFI